jgi:sec-independent protein translocase protein TatC
MAEPAKRAVVEESAEAELEGGRMPFLSHLTELRDRVRNAAIVFMLAFVVCWFFAKDIFEWLREPLFQIWLKHPAWGPPQLIYTGLTQPFWVDMSIGLWAGIFVASPFMFYQVWRFIAPGLYKSERRLTIYFAVFSAVFFVAGALFCFYVVLPQLYNFLLSYNTETVKSLPNLQEYLDLTRDMMLAFGAVFELPLFILFLSILGMVTHRGLWKFNRWFVVIAFVVGAILTPSPDPYTQTLMALPMILLYNFSIILSWRVTIKRERKAAALEKEHE